VKKKLRFDYGISKSRIPTPKLLSTGFHRGLENLEEYDQMKYKAELTTNSPTKQSQISEEYQTISENPSGGI